MSVSCKCGSTHMSSTANLKIKITHVFCCGKQ